MAHGPLHTIPPIGGASVGVPGLGDLVAPGPAPAVVPQTPEEEEQLTSEWLDFLRNPEVQAGLLQFAINAMQPVAPGRGTAAHLGAAVASGGEAIGRVRAQRQESAEERRKAGLEERRVATGEEQVQVQREQAATAGATAEADRKSRELISQNKIEAAGRVLEEEVRVRLEISENTKDAGILGVASNMLIQRDKGILAALLPGDTPQGLSTTEELFELYKRLKRVAAGEEPFQEGDIPIEEMVRLFLGTPEEQAAAERAITRLHPADQARIRQRVEEQRTEVEPVPTGEVSEEVLSGRKGRTPTEISEGKGHAEALQRAVQFVRERMELGFSRNRALTTWVKFAKEQGIDISRAEVSKALR